MCTPLLEYEYVRCPICQLPPSACQISQCTTAEPRFIRLKCFLLADQSYMRAAVPFFAILYAVSPSNLSYTSCTGYLVWLDRFLVDTRFSLLVSSTSWPFFLDLLINAVLVALANVIRLSLVLPPLLEFSTSAARFAHQTITTEIVLSGHHNIIEFYSIFSPFLVLRMRTASPIRVRDMRILQGAERTRPN